MLFSLIGDERCISFFLPLSLSFSLSFLPSLSFSFFLFPFFLCFILPLSLFFFVSLFFFLLSVSFFYFCFLLPSFRPFLISYFVSHSLFHIFFRCSFHPRMRFNGKAVVGLNVVLCDHNPSVSKQGDLASGFPFCISLRPWMFCVSGTAPYSVPKFKNLHKAKEWSVRSFPAVHTSYIEKCCWMKRKHYLQIIVYEGKWFMLCCFDHCVFFPQSCINEMFWCVWKVYTSLFYMLNCQKY